MNISRFFSRINQLKMNKTELAALRISMLIAALDGDIAKSEIDAFHTMSENCEDYSPKEVETAFLDTLRAAGYIMVLARVSDRETLLNAFLAEAKKLLPKLLDFGTGGINTAISLWTGMAKADGDYSEVEQEAIRRLKDLIATMAI